MFVVHYTVSDGQSLKDVCAEIEAQQSWEDEQFMQEIEQKAWDEYQAGVCPCGDPECGGIGWLLNGDDPFEF